MTDHIVRSYDVDLESLRRTIAEMGGIAEDMVGNACQALTSRDVPMAQAVIATDVRLDELQRQVDENAVLVIMRRQPMAIDLRDTVSAIRISGDLERVGDHAKSVAKRVVAIAGQMHPPRIVHGVQHMGELVQQQLKDVLDAYARRDIEHALDVWRRDGETDALYTSLFRELLTYMMEDPRNISFCTHLLFCAKAIERIGDHTTNIAETVHYLVTGRSLTQDRPKNDRTTSEALADALP